MAADTRTRDTETPDVARRRNVYLGIGLAFGLLVAAYFLYQVRGAVFAFLVALLISIILAAPVNWLAHRGLGRGLAALVVFGGLALVLAVAVAALAPVIADQVRQLVETLPTLLQSAQDLLERAQGALGLQLRSTPDPQQLLDSAQSYLSGGTFTTILGAGASAASLLSLTLVVLVSTVFMVVTPRPMVNGFVSFFPAGRRERTREVLNEMYEAVQRWFLGQLADMVLVGILYTIALSVIGVPFALLFGILGGLICFVPFVGPIVSAIPPALVALFDEPVQAPLVLLVYLVIQLLESNVIQPVVMSRAVSLHPVVIVFSILIMGNLFGIVGVVLAVPLVAALQVLVRELWVRRMDEKGIDPNPPEKDQDSSMGRGLDRLRRAAGALFRRS